MPITGVMPEPAVTKRKLPPLGRQHELAGRLLEVDERAGPQVVDEVVADQTVGDGLDGDRDEAVGAGAVGQRVGAPLADAVDVDADPDVLAGDVAGPVGAGPDHERGGVAGLGVDLPIRPRRSAPARRGAKRSRKSAGTSGRRWPALGQPTRAGIARGRDSMVIQSCLSD